MPPSNQPYDIDFAERGLIREHIWEFLLYPVQWNEAANQISVALHWDEIPFDSSQLMNVPNDQKGVYVFVLKPAYTNFIETRYLFYAGMTGRNFRARFKEYLNDAEGKGKPRPRVYKMLKLFKGYLHFYYANISNDADIEECEVRLLNTFVPRVNTDIPSVRIKPELKDIYL